MNTILSYIFYWLGCVAWHVFEIIETDAPHSPEWVWDLVYWTYSRSMGKSADFDKNESVWLSRRDGETEESFDRRFRLKYGD